jgi:hypothetical protein
VRVMSTTVIQVQASRAFKDVYGFLAQLGSEIHLRDLRTGRWYTKVLTAYIAYYEAQRQRESRPRVPVAERAAVAKALIEHAALVTACAGAGAAAGVTAATIITAETGGLAAPVALPLSGLGVVSELLMRSIMHLRMSCELADLYGMPFVPGGEIELIRLQALAVNAEMHETEDDPGRGLVERVTRLQEAGGLGKLIAAGLIGETLLRNAVPFADVAVSSVRNWQLTLQVGQFVQGYASRRVALDEAVSALGERSPGSVELLLEGIWFIFISDGRLTGVETALLAHLMRAQSTSQDLTKHFVSDEAGWLERLHQIEPNTEVRTLLVRALEVAAVIEKPVSPTEQTILLRASETLGVALVDLSAVGALEQPILEPELPMAGAVRWLGHAASAVAKGAVVFGARLKSTQVASAAAS